MFKTLKNTEHTMTCSKRLKTRKKHSPSPRPHSKSRGQLSNNRSRGHIQVVYNLMYMSLQANELCRALFRPGQSSGPRHFCLVLKFSKDQDSCLLAIETAFSLLSVIC